MMRTLSILIFAMALALPAAAQTTGIPGFNDYTISGSTSGSTSCTLLTLPAGVHSFTIDTMPGTVVEYWINSVPCTYTGIMGCQGSFIDLSLSPLPTLVYTAPVPSGVFSVFAYLPPALSFSTQCVVYIPGCLPWFSQAYDVQT